MHPDPEGQLRTRILHAIAGRIQSEHDDISQNSGRGQDIPIEQDTRTTQHVEEGNTGE